MKKASVFTLKIYSKCKKSKVIVFKKISALPWGAFVHARLETRVLWGTASLFLFVNTKMNES